MMSHQRSALSKTRLLQMAAAVKLEQVPDQFLRILGGTWAVRV